MWPGEAGRQGPPPPEPLPPLPPGRGSPPGRGDPRRRERRAAAGDRDLLGEPIRSRPAPPSRGSSPGTPARRSARGRARCWPASTSRRGDPAAARARLQEHTRPSTADPIVLFVRGLLEARENQAPRRARAPEPLRRATAHRRAFPNARRPSCACWRRSATTRAASGDPAGGLAEWERYARHGAAREAERAYAGQRAEAIGARLGEEAAAQLYRSAGSDFTRAAVGVRAAAALRARGDAGGARRVEEDTTRLRRSLGWSSEAAGVGPGDPHRLGLLAPFSGPGRPAGRGRAAGRDAGHRRRRPGRASPCPSRSWPATPPPIGTGVSERAAFELVREEAAIALVGVGDRRAVRLRRPGRRAGAAARRSRRRARPAPASRCSTRPRSGPPSWPAARSRSGCAASPSSAPTTPRGQRLAEAFSRAVAAGGGQGDRPGPLSGRHQRVHHRRRASFAAPRSKRCSWPTTPPGWSWWRRRWPRATSGRSPGRAPPPAPAARRAGRARPAGGPAALDRGGAQPPAHPQRGPLRPGGAAGARFLLRRRRSPVEPLRGAVPRALRPGSGGRRRLRLRRLPPAHRGHRAGRPQPLGPAAGAGERARSRA